MLQDLQPIISAIINIFISSYSGPRKLTGWASHIPTIILGFIVTSAGFIYNTYKIAPLGAPPQLVNITHLPPLTISNPFPLDIRCPAATMSCPPSTVTYLAPTTIYSTRNSAPISSCASTSITSSPPDSFVTCPPALPPVYHSSIVDSIYREVLGRLGVDGRNTRLAGGAASGSGIEGASTPPLSKQPTPSLPTCLPPAGVMQDPDEVSNGVPGTGDHCCRQIACGQVRIGGNRDNDPYYQPMLDFQSYQTLLPRDESPLQPRPTSTSTAIVEAVDDPQFVTVHPPPEMDPEKAEEYLGLLLKAGFLHCRKIDGRVECKKIPLVWPVNSGNETLGPF